MTKRRAKPVSNSKLHAPLLTHMRAVAYAPVNLPEAKSGGLDAITAAELKRLRKQQKRISALI